MAQGLQQRNAAKRARIFAKGWQAGAQGTSQESKQAGSQAIATGSQAMATGAHATGSQGMTHAGAHGAQQRVRKDSMWQRSLARNAAKGRQAGWQQASKQVGSQAGAQGSQAAGAQGSQAVTSHGAQAFRANKRKPKAWAN